MGFGRHAGGKKELGPGVTTARVQIPATLKRIAAVDMVGMPSSCSYCFSRCKAKTCSRREIKAENFVQHLQQFRRIPQGAGSDRIALFDAIFEI
jgi:hypothetical protein